MPLAPFSDWDAKLLILENLRNRKQSLSALCLLTVKAVQEKSCCPDFCHDGAFIGRERERERKRERETERNRGGREGSGREGGKKHCLNKLFVRYSISVTGKESTQGNLYPSCVLIIENAQFKSTSSACYILDFDFFSIEGIVS